MLGVVIEIAVVAVVFAPIVVVSDGDRGINKGWGIAIVITTAVAAAPAVVKVETVAAAVEVRSTGPETVVAPVVVAVAEVASRSERVPAGCAGSGRDDALVRRGLLLPL